MLRVLTQSAKSFRNFTERPILTFVWLQYFCFEICELRDIFSQKDTGNQYFYFPGPLDEQNNTNMAVASRFSVWAEKRRNRTDITKQIRSGNAL